MLSSSPKIVRVILDVPLARAFDYIGMNLTDADIGKRVSVPFAGRERVGLIWAVVTETTVALDKLKSISCVLDDAPIVSGKWRALCQFCSDYYHYPLGAVVFTALPARLRQARLLGSVYPAWIMPSEAGVLALTALPLRASAKRRVGDALLAGPMAWPTEDDAAVRRLLRTWWDLGWLQAAPSQVAPVLPVAAPYALSEDQAAAVAILRAERKPALLFGVTGSGKTEVYLQRVADVLAEGKQALLLVPEINLTPQLIHRVSARFPTARIACLHSGVADGARATEWLACGRGEREIILGTRLAVFTPLLRPGIIIVDEEHDASYKQQDSLRYSARDLALVRGQLEEIPVLLGSATPVLESWWNAQQQRYRLICLRGRTGQATLPPIALIDIRRLPLQEGLSQPVLDALQETQRKGEQSLLFINRRGFAPVLYCDGCGWQAACPRCSGKLVLHRNRPLLCHHCGFQQAIPRACPSCGNPDLKAIGQGTQRLESALAAHLPTARVARVDRDSMSKKDSWTHMQAEIAAGNVDVLIGTQMLAKGHDFANLTLVVVVDVDGGLFSADFRAAERLFAQLLQVAGRAGRATLPGRVLIQTGQATHPVFDFLQRYDFAGFAEWQLEERHACALPPYQFMAIVRAEHPQLQAAIRWLQLAQEAAHTLFENGLGDVHVFDPVPALMVRVANKERGQLIVQSANRRTLQLFLAAWMPLLYAIPKGKVHWSLEVDPLEL